MGLILWGHFSTFRFFSNNSSHLRLKHFRRVFVELEITYIAVCTIPKLLEIIKLQRIDVVTISKYFAEFKISYRAVFKPLISSFRLFSNN